MHTIIATLLLTAIVVLAVFIVVSWRLRSESIYAGRGVMIKKQGPQALVIQLDELTEINFNYQAVAEFNGIWEFKDTSGKKITADYDTTGIKSTLKLLESQLKDFSLENFRHDFKAGDLEGTISIWRRT